MAPGDPGVDDLFSDAVYIRGAMTLQALREEVGRDAFFEILRTWTAERGDPTGTTDQFVTLAETVSGMQLDELFDEWLFTTSRARVLRRGARAGRRGDPDADVRRRARTRDRLVGPAGSGGCSARRVGSPDAQELERLLRLPLALERGRAEGRTSRPISPGDDAASRVRAPMVMWPGADIAWSRAATFVVSPMTENDCWCRRRRCRSRPARC